MHGTFNHTHKRSWRWLRDDQHGLTSGLRKIRKNAYGILVHTYIFTAGLHLSVCSRMKEELVKTGEIKNTKPEVSLCAETATAATEASLQ